MWPRFDPHLLFIPSLLTPDWLTEHLDFYIFSKNEAETKKLFKIVLIATCNKKDQKLHLLAFHTWVIYLTKLLGYLRYNLGHLLEQYNFWGIIVG